MPYPEAPRGPTPNAPQIQSMRHQVLVLYRPVDACPRCRSSRSPDDEEADAIDPEEIPLDCPHVQKEDYDKLLQQFVEGRISFTQQTETTLKNGQVQVSVAYVIFAAPIPRGQPAPPRDL